VIGFLVLFLIAATRDLGTRRTVLYLGWALGIALVAELASTRVGFPFGLYHYTGLTRGQELFIAGVPFFDSLSFTFLAYAAYCLARRILAQRSGSGSARAILTGFFMMMLDVVIDPAAVRGERWFLGHLFYYPDGGVYFGVPLSNFAGWWLVGGVGVAAYQACVRPIRPLEAGRENAGIALYYAVFLFNLAVTGWIGEWTLLAVGLAVHAVMAAVLVAITRRAPVRDVLGTGGVQRV
jgi:putative membrane protein